MWRLKCGWFWFGLVSSFSFLYIHLFFLFIFFFFFSHQLVASSDFCFVYVLVHLCGKQKMRLYGSPLSVCYYSFNFHKFYNTVKSQEITTFYNLLYIVGLDKWWQIGNVFDLQSLIILCDNVLLVIIFILYIFSSESRQVIIALFKVSFSLPFYK